MAPTRKRLRLAAAVEKAGQWMEHGSDLSFADDVVELEGGGTLVLLPILIRIERTAITIGIGILSTIDEDSGALLPNKAVTVIRQGEQFCYEEDDILETVADYLEDEMSIDEMENLWCELCIVENI